MHCCGLFSYSDWEDNVPDSCLCDPGTEVGECQSVTYTVSSAQTAVLLECKGH